MSYFGLSVFRSMMQYRVKRGALHAPQGEHGVLGSLRVTYCTILARVTLFVIPQLAMPELGVFAC